MELKGDNWDEIVEAVTNGEYDGEEYAEDDTEDWGSMDFDTDTGICGACGRHYCLCCGCDCYWERDEDEDTEDDWEPGEYDGPELFTTVAVDDRVQKINNILEDTDNE